MTEQSMVEKVARETFDVTPFRDVAGPYEAQSDEYRRLCRVYARAAIEAMREPSGMIDAIGNTNGVWQPLLDIPEDDSDA